MLLYFAYWPPVLVQFNRLLCVPEFFVPNICPVQVYC